jgi:hypothetical protein
MYETPQVIRVGCAPAVILGISQIGWDPDGSDFPLEFEFYDDSLETER